MYVCVCLYKSLDQNRVVYANDHTCDTSTQVV